MFGSDLKAQAKLRRELFVIKAGHAVSLPLKNATIHERVPCEHSKDGLHYVTATIKNGHIQAFSCECRDTVSELDLKIEHEIHEGSIKTCYGVFLRLENFIREYKPSYEGGKPMIGSEKLPVLNPVLAQVRHASYGSLHDARKSYANHLAAASLRVGDYSLPRVYRTAYLLRNMLRNYFHPAIAEMFQVRIFDDNVNSTDPREPIIKVSFKDYTVFYADQYMRPTYNKISVASMNRTPAEYTKDTIHKAAFGSTTELPNNTVCMFCGDGKVYPRMKGHLAREPHRKQEERVVMKFFNHFFMYRTRNLQRLRASGAHRHQDHEMAGFRKLVSTEFALKAEADAKALEPGS